MKVRMRTLAAGPDGTLYAGQVYELPAETAQALIDGGYAEAVGRVAPDGARGQVKAAPETAAVEPAENAARPAGRKRKARS